MGGLDVLINNAGIGELSRLEDIKLNQFENIFHCFDLLSKTDFSSIETIKSIHPLKIERRIDYYKNNHNLDELGIDEENPLTGLITLVELIKPELSYKEVKSIEKREE